MPILVALAGVANLICFIYVVVKIFKSGNTGIAVVSILTCGLVAFIYGWSKAEELDLKRLMLIWTAAICVQLLTTFLLLRQGVA